MARILLPVSDLTTPFDPAWSKTYIVTKFWLKHNFSGILSHVLLRMRRNGQNTTSGIKSDHAIRSGMPENLYVCEIVAENAILMAFEACLHCACAEGAEYYFRFQI